MAAEVFPDGVIYDFDGYGNSVPIGKADAQAVAALRAADPTASSFSFDKILDVGAQLGTALLTFSQQSDINKINLERARQGLPPLDAAYTGVGVNVGLSPATQKLVIYGGLAALAFLIFNSVTRRK
jgi:hypothetical protein